MGRMRTRIKLIVKRPDLPIKEAFRFAILYLVVGCLWIGLSDKILDLFGNVSTMLLVSTLKGWFYVLVTAALLFLLVRARAGKLWQYQEHLEDMIQVRTAEYEKAQREALEYSAEKDLALERMNHLSEFEGIVLRFAQELINVPIEGIEVKLADSIESIGRHLNEDRIFYAEYDYDRQICSTKLEWNNPHAASSVGPEITRPFHLIGDMIETHERGDVYYVSDVLKNELDEDLDSMVKRFHIRSFMTIPIASKNRPYGFIGISSLGKTKTWQEDDLAILKIFAEIVRNIFERRERELLLQQSNRNMRVLLDSTNDGIFLLDKSGTIININNAAAALLGKTVEQATGGKLQELMPSRILDQRGHILWDTFSTGKVGHFFGQRDNLWIDTRYYPVFEPDGAVGAVATFSTDLTERVNAENEIYKSRQMLKEIIDNTPVGIFWRNTENKVFGYNRVAAQIAGFSDEEVAAGKADSMLAVSLANGQKDNNFQILQSGKPKLNYEASLVNTRGETRIVNMSKVPLLDKEGKPYALLGVMEDMTEQKRMIQELVQARQNAYEASKAKSAFLSMMSHEIRTPLNTIIGLTHIARHSGHSQPALMVEYLEKIDASSRHLLGIINDILDISRIEAGKMTITNMAFDFEAFMEETVEIVQPKADEKRQELGVYLDGGIPPRLEGDPMRLKQVLVNLVFNAVKFTPDFGKITVRAALAEKNENRIVLTFSVKDNGIGIPAGKLGSLFSPFEQLDMKMAREHSGTGLGLAISKNIVEMMGGSISVRSEEGAGSEFSFTVPLEAVPCAHHQAGQLDFSELNVLVADDEPETCTYLEMMLKSFSVHCDIAYGGNAAVAMALSAEEAGKPYNVAIVDWRMPDRNGIETAREIKRISGDETSVIMISKYDLDQAGEQLREAGISLFLPKPVFPSRLLAILKEITSNSQPAPTSARSSIQDSFRGKKILVVEDMEINQLILREMLRETGAEVLPAMDGAQALNIFASRDGKIDAILMDVQMPGMDGYEATRQIRASGRKNAGEVVILAMTANAYREDVEAAMRAGMNGHIAKPIDFGALYEKLRQYLVQAD